MNEVRPLSSEDLPALAELVEAAGWNQTAGDWLRVMRLQPDGCFGIAVEGRVVSTATAVVYDEHLAWIGMVLTHPAYRGYGLARRLMEHSLQYLRRSAVRWVKLDATEMGRPLYVRLGFVDECPVQRWQRRAGRSLVTPLLNAIDLEKVLTLDRQVFGADRSRLLRDLANEAGASIGGEGFALYRPGRLADYFGPCVALSTSAARRLLQDFLNRYGDRDTFLDLLPGNKQAVALAEESGFQPARHLVRMSLRLVPGARELPARNDAIFAIAGFEYG